MDSQNTNAPKRAITPEEIARLEAEAVAARLRGEEPPKREPAAASQDPGAAAEAEPSAPAFVPYVDDVPELPAESADIDDEDDEPYVPSAMEKRLDALTPEQWRLWQIVGGAAVGLCAVACLFVFGEELATYGLIVAVLLAVLLPRYLERAWRRKLTTARYAMIVAMVAGLVIMGVVTWMRGGFAVKT